MISDDVGLHNLFVLIVAEASFMMMMKERKCFSNAQERRIRYVFITTRLADNVGNVTFRSLESL